MARKVKRPPDDKGVTNITREYIIAEEEMTKVIFEPKTKVLYVQKARINLAIKGMEKRLKSANITFAKVALKNAYLKGKSKVNSELKKRVVTTGGGGNSQIDYKSSSNGTADIGQFKDLRRGAFIDLQSGMLRATAKLRAKVAKVIESLDNKNRNLKEFTEKIKGVMTDEGILEMEYKNGAKIKLKNYAQMLARSSRIETENLGFMNRGMELGAKLVKCIGQSPTCEMCATFRDRVYSVDGSDKRFPPLYGTALREGYHIIHPNCRCEFVPYFEEYETKEQVEKDIAFSRKSFKDSRTKKERDEYALWQKINRQLWSEEEEYNTLKTQLCEDMPYKTIGSFRRAKRDECNGYLYAKATARAGIKRKKILTNLQQSGTIDIQIDELTPCLRDTRTGELLETEFFPMGVSEAATLKKKGWLFNWEKPHREGLDVVKLTLKADSETQGVIAYKDSPKDHAVYVQLAEAAPSNFGAKGLYKGVGGHLFAIACIESLKKGYGGFVYLDAKTNLIGHYQKEIGAKVVHGQRMYIDENAAQKLIERYFKNERE